MARQLPHFPRRPPERHRRYPWEAWTDGSVWEIRRGVDYDVATENMRINLHMRGDLALRKVRARKVRDEQGEGLIFQFVESDEAARVRDAMAADARATRAALDALYTDARALYEWAGQEVTIERSDRRRQKFLSSRYLDQFERGHAEGMLVPTVASMIRNRNRGSGFEHLARAGRPDLTLESLVVDGTKPYRRLFTAQTREIAARRLEPFS